MSSSGIEGSSIIPSDGLAGGSGSKDANRPGNGVRAPGVAVRNVQTQHGDYRSVDEENIVVLRNCLSPVPGSVSPDLPFEDIKIGSLEDGKVKASEDGKGEPAVEGMVTETGDLGQAAGSGEIVEEQVVWIEPFDADGNEVSVFYFGRSSYILPFELGTGGWVLYTYLNPSFKKLIYRVDVASMLSILGYGLNIVGD